MDRAPVRSPPRVRAAAVDPALIGPDPRVIADEVWAKLMWAGLNLTDRGPARPRERSAAIRGIRSSSSARSRCCGCSPGCASTRSSGCGVGAIRWQHRPERRRRARTVCLLDVPTNKTATAFTKPVDRPSARRSKHGRRVRPAQPRVPDRKTGELVDMLFAYRGAQLGEKYVNRALIPLLCRKAGVPREDVRGQITGHRARATIASQLYNAKEPMSLFELQAWLGHQLAELDPALRADHADHAGQGLHRRRLLRPQRPRDRGAARPRRDQTGARRQRRAVRVLRPRARLLHLQLLRAVPAPDGVRPLRLLHPQALERGAAARSEGRHAADARRRSRSPKRNERQSRATTPPSTASSQD